MHALPFRDASFDSAIMFHTLTYAEHPARALAECARVLRPGGRFVLLCLDEHRQSEVTARYGERHPGFSPRTVREPAHPGGARRRLRGGGLAARSRSRTFRWSAPSRTNPAHQDEETQLMTRQSNPLHELLEHRIAIIDGAMGTTIRTYGMKEADIRGERFKDAQKDLLNNGDIFSLTQPEMICDIHRRFLEAGADIICTNTFGATSISQSEFFVDDPREHGGRKDPAFYQKIIETPFLNDLAWEINEQSARQCRQWADRVANADGRRRFVAGAIGPLTVSLSNSPDAEDPGFRVVTFDQVKAAYVRQVRALIAGGSDMLLVETIFDSLNAKAALVAIQEVFDEDHVQAAGHDLGGGRPGRRDDDLGADGGGVLERGRARQSALGRPQLLPRARPHVSVSVGALAEVDRRGLLLSERRAAQPAVADRFRPGAGRHGPLPGPVRAVGA